MIRYVLALLAIALVPLSAVGQVQLPPAVAQITANPIGARAALGIPDALMSTLATRAPQPGGPGARSRQGLDAGSALGRSQKPAPAPLRTPS